MLNSNYSSDVTGREKHMMVEKDHGNSQESPSNQTEENHEREEALHCSRVPSKLSPTSPTQSPTDSHQLSGSEKRPRGNQSLRRQDNENCEIFGEEKSISSGAIGMNSIELCSNIKKRSVANLSEKFNATKIARQSDNGPLDLSCHKRHTVENVLKKHFNENSVKSMSHCDNLESLQVKKEPPNDAFETSKELCNIPLPEKRNNVSKKLIKLKPSQLSANTIGGSKHLKTTAETEVSRRCDTSMNNAQQERSLWSMLTSTKNLPPSWLSHFAKDESFSFSNICSNSHENEFSPLLNMMPKDVLMKVLGIASLETNEAQTSYLEFWKQKFLANFAKELSDTKIGCSSFSTPAKAFQQLSIAESSTPSPSGTINSQSSVKDQLHHRESPPESFCNNFPQGAKIDNCKAIGKDTGKRFENLHPGHHSNSSFAFHPYKSNRSKASNQEYGFSTMVSCSNDTNVFSDTSLHAMATKDCLPEKCLGENNLASEKGNRRKTHIWPKVLTINDNSLGPPVSAGFPNSFVGKNFPVTASQESGRNGLHSVIYNHLPSIAFPHRKTCDSRNPARPVTFKPCKIPCTVCGRTYATTGALAKHTKTHQDPAKAQTLNCTICSKECSSLSSLRMHIRTHTLPCECYICGKAFSRTWLLQGHIRTHTGEKPYQCMVCTRAFADRSNLRAHMQTHETIKRYSCKNCEKTFSRISLLKRHQEQCVHSKSQQENPTLSESNL